MNKNIMQTGTTKQAFVDALCQLACKRPIAKVTVKEIADKAGYNRSTFYQYFQDVYDLLDYLASLAVQRIKANVIENIQAQHVGEAFVQAFTQMHHEEAKYFDILFHPDNVPFFIRCVKCELRPLLIQKFNLSESSLRTDYVLEYYLSAVIAVVGNWIAKGRNIPAEELASMIREISQASLGQSVKSDT